MSDLEIIARRFGLKSSVTAKDNLEGADPAKITTRKVSFYASSFVGADLIKANLKGADMVGADMRWINLHQSDLYGANLSHARLDGANMFRARLTKSILRGTGLSYAYLGHAELHDAELSKACLYRANLSMADLTGANLQGADLTEVTLWDTTGNGREIRSFRGRRNNRFNFAYTSTDLQIDGKNLAIEAWRRFDTRDFQGLCKKKEINAWARKKDSALSYIEQNPATPHAGDPRCQMQKN